jgi:hypothetical protein
MKNLKLNLCSLLFVLLTISQIAGAQSGFIQLHFTDGTQQNFTLSEVQKIDFTSTEMRLHQTDATIISWNYNLIDFYRYVDIETNVDKSANLAAEIYLDVFPNPASGILNVRYQFPIQELSNIAIYAMNGKRMFEQRLQNTQEGIWQKDITDLPVGSYILVIQGNNFSISKTIIKQ